MLLISEELGVNFYTTVKTQRIIIILLIEIIEGEAKRSPNNRSDTTRSSELMFVEMG